MNGYSVLKTFKSYTDKMLHLTAIGCYILQRQDAISYSDRMLHLSGRGCVYFLVSFSSFTTSAVYLNLANPFCNFSMLVFSAS